MNYDTAPMRYPLAINTWGPEERRAVAQVIRSGRTTMGEETEKYEREFAEHFGARYAVAVNSGSSANLLMVAAQFHLPRGRLLPGDEVIVPTMGWATTYAPLHQLGLRMRFVDVDPDTLCLQGDSVRRAVTRRTRAVLVVNLLGNMPDLHWLRNFCDERDLVLLEDNCEGMGAHHGGRSAGTFGHCGTFSTFFSHHLSTMEGGVVLTDDEEAYHVLLSLRSHGWTRGQPPRSQYHREDPDAWEFVLPGYNVRPLEVCTAAGRHQIRKLPRILEWRRKNHQEFVRLFSDLPDVRVVPGSEGSSHFGLALTLEGRLAGFRDALRAHLAERNVESRTVVSGNFLRHPVAALYEHDVPFSADVADHVHDRGIMLGNHGCDMRRALAHVREAVGEFVGGAA